MTSSAEKRHPIILFDGLCNLCTSSVRFVIERDARQHFRFASLQSSLARTLLGPEEAERRSHESVILIADGRIYRRSTAALLIARHLDGLWPLLAIFLLIPRPLRDATYDWIGSRRYRMFGKRDVCWTPHAELRDRFLD